MPSKPNKDSKRKLSFYSEKTRNSRMMLELIERTPTKLFKIQAHTRVLWLALSFSARSDHSRQRVGNQTHRHSDWVVWVGWAKTVAARIDQDSARLLISHSKAQVGVYLGLQVMGQLVELEGQAIQVGLTHHSWITYCQHHHLRNREGIVLSVQMRLGDNE
jgi:hypothetical protein